MSDETAIKGMGSILHTHGVAFRVWAPHAQHVSVIGSFNEWDGTKHSMQSEKMGIGTPISLKPMQVMSICFSSQRLKVSSNG